jgi:hypothetical protein
MCPACGIDDLSGTVDPGRVPIRDAVDERHIELPDDNEGQSLDLVEPVDEVRTSVTRWRDTQPPPAAIVCHDGRESPEHHRATPGCRRSAIVRSLEACRKVTVSPWRASS